MSAQEVDWSRPSVASRHIFRVASIAIRHLENLPADPSLPRIARLAPRIHQELGQFIGDIMTAHDRYYRVTGHDGIPDTATVHSLQHHVYDNNVVPFASLELTATDVRGNLLVAQGLNVYDDPERPHEASARFTRLQRGERFVPVTMPHYDATELQDLHERLITITD